MPLVLDRSRVMELYAAAETKRWVLPAFNSENLTTTEAVLAAAQEFGEVPIIIGITNTYWHRPQAVYYTHSRDWHVGLRLFLADLRELTGPHSPYRNVPVMIHLDHIQHDTDAELLRWDLRQFSSIMYDASTLPMAQNIEQTSAFRQRWGDRIVVEGACDEVGEASTSVGVTLTVPDVAERYYRATGVDLIVANLGTEHRADAATLQYHGELAREITRRIGPHLCLHGTSSVPPEQVTRLFDDGVRKVNIWTALERDSTPALLADLAKPRTGLWYTTTHRQEIIFGEMKRIVRQFLELWYR